MSIMNAMHSRIRKGGAQVLILQSIGMVLLFLMNLIIARNIDVRQFGIYSYSIYLSGLLSKVFTLGWPTSLLRFVAQYVEQRRWGSLKGLLVRAYQVNAMSCCVVSGGILAASLLPSIRPETAVGLRLSAAVTPFLMATRLRRSIFQALRNFRASIVPEDVAHPILMIIAVTALGIESAVNLVILYAFIAWFLFVLSSYWMKKSLPHEVRTATSHFETNHWIRTALPLTLSGVGFLLLNRTSILLLGTMSDMASVALYSAASRVSMLLSVVIGSVETVVTSLIVGAYHGGRITEFHRIMTQARQWTLLLTVPAFLVMLIWPEQLLGYFGPEYRAGCGLLQILACGQLVNAATGPVGYAISLTGKERLAMWITVLSAALNVVLNLIAIPRWGVLGAAAATSGSVMAMNAVMYSYVALSPHYRGQDRQVPGT